MPISEVREIYAPKNLDQLEPTRGFNHPLSEIDLSFLGQSTQHSTHSIHTYVAAINPPLVSALIEHFVPTNGNILDPYCGGGGVLVEGILNGRQVTGGDINPLAVYLSKAKTHYIPRATLELCYNVVLQDALNYNTIELEKIPNQIRFWFKDYMLQPLEALRRAIHNIPELITEHKHELLNLFRVILSATVRDIMLTYRGEVRLRKLRGLDYDKFNPNVLEAFQKRAISTIEKVSSLPENLIANVSLIDACNLPYNNDEFTSIICSPPYGDDKNGVGYFQFSRNMLYFLNHDLNEIKEFKKKFHGDIKDNKQIPPSESLILSLNNVKQRNLTHYKEGIAFYHDYYLALKEMKRVTSGKIIIVIGNRVLSRTFFDNARITTQLLNQLEVQLEYHFQRIIPKKRIPNLGTDGGGMNVEHILVFQK